ncbi:MULTISPECIES: S-layer homology domain-containing protein [Paenibacillus]|uniref:S-layer homology domain-containing protein n=1 Tax=Paenibacillus TaxID=44249 RepID=UPI002FE27162
MTKKRSKDYKLAAKAACTGIVAISLLVPAGWAGAEAVHKSTKTTSITVTDDGASAPSGIPLDHLSDGMKLKIASGEVPMPGTETPDPALAKFSKEQAVAKIKELFPDLKNYEAERIELGITNVFPRPANQMVWNINWSFRDGNTYHGFDSQVDAITGDLISTYLSIPNDKNETYYPHKLTREEALEKAKAFISKAAPSVSLQDLKAEDTDVWGRGSSLFGPMEYNFHFNLLHKGIPTSSEYLYVVIDGNGQVTSFSKSPERPVYPEAAPTVAPTEAEQVFKKQLDVELAYHPVYKNSEITGWVLGWQPSEPSSYPIDAITGKRFDYQGADISEAPRVYTPIPAGKKTFAPHKTGKELTADEAVNVVKKAAKIPEGRTLSYSRLDTDYMNSERKIWRITWDEQGGKYNVNTTPAQTTAEVDALTGQLLEFRMEEFGAQTAGTTAASKAAQASTLSKEAAKRRAFEVVNQLVPDATLLYKLVEQEGEDHLTENKAGYRYSFRRFIKDIPVNSRDLTVNLDLNGELQYFGIGRETGVEKLTGEQAAKISKEEALKAFQDQYGAKLQYLQTGGHYADNTYVKEKIRLAYVTELKGPAKDGQILDAMTGQWVTVFENGAGAGSKSEPSDLKGHRAEEELTALLQYNIISPDPNGHIKPDEEIAAGEWLTMMAKAVSPYELNYGLNQPAQSKAVSAIPADSPYYNGAVYAAERKWINPEEEFDAEAKLTREQLAVMLASIAKYNKLASFLKEDESLNTFADKEDIKHKGEVALAIKLGLLQGQNGRFNPAGKVTRAEAASVIMTLVKLQGKMDQSVMQ